MLKNFLLAGGAIMFLALMGQKSDHHLDVNGHNNHHTVTHQGLVTISLESLMALELKQGDESWWIKYDKGAWFYGEERLSENEQSKVTEYFSMLRNSKPVRVFQPEELNVKEASVYGLETPTLETSVITDTTLAAEDRGTDSPNDTSTIESIRFGHVSPDGRLRYAKREGDTALYVMSGFIFSQAEEVIGLLKKRKDKD